MRPKAALLTCLLLAWVLQGWARAQPCTPEVEPNDAPLAATAVAGLGCVTGALGPGDQDLFAWTLTAQDLQGQGLALELESIPGSLTTLLVTRLTLDAQGRATDRQDLLALTTPDGARVAKELAALEPGTYYLGLSASGGEGSYTVTARRAAPTDFAAEAVPLGASLAASGAFGASGKAVYGFATDAPGLYRVQALGEGVRALAYHDAGGAKLKEAEGAAPLRLDDLALPAGQHYLELSGTGSHILKVIPLGPIPAGTATLGPEPASPPAEATAEPPAAACVREVEPNDGPAEATALARLACAEGQLGARETDYLAFAVGPEQAGRRLAVAFAAAAPGYVTLALIDAAGERLQTRYAEGSITLPDLQLPEGSYLLSLASSQDAPLAYRVTFADEGAPQAGLEREPNDRVQDATPLGSSIQGRMVGSDDDLFALSAQGEPQLWRFEAIGTGLTDIAFLDGSGREVLRRRGAGDQDRLQMGNVFVLPGTSYLLLRGTDASYTLRAIPLGPPDAAGDRPAGKNEHEPNDDPTRAEPLRFGETRVGLLAERDDVDLYRFTLYAPETVRLEVAPGAGGGVGARIDDVGERYHDAAPDEATALELPLLPGDHYVQLHATQPGDGYYRVRLSRPEPAAGGDLEVALALETPEVAAYWAEGQRVTGEVTLTNRSSAAREVDLTATSSHYAWAPWLGAASLTLQAGERRAIPVGLDILPDARDDQPVRLTVEARADGAASAAALELSAVCGAPPVGAQRLWPLPEPLLGGLDMAWAGLGGTIVGDDSMSAAALIDGLVSPATGWSADPGESVTVALGGDGPVEVAGFLLNPYGRTAPDEQLRSFKIALSSDGRTFQTVLAGELSAAPTEQAFALERPVPARFARLTALGAHRDTPYRIGLGEFKVVAAPASRPLAAPLNLAAPGAGGYVVWSQPLLGDPKRLIDEALDSPSYVSSDDGSGTWVIGFHNDRAAQIGALEWRAVAADGSNARLGDLEVAVSLESPVGPWQPLGTWRAGEARFVLEAPAWARFVRLRAEGLQPRGSYQFPGVLRVLERPADASYRSAAGEWGQSQRAAIYEQLEPAPAGQPLAEADDNDSQARAQPLASGQEVAGAVAIGEDLDWYAVNVPEGQNTLELALEGEPVLGVAYTLVDAQGASVFYEEEATPSGVTLTAAVRPGRYFFKLEEPPRSVVFAWDNSGSMGAYLDIIYQTVAAFAAEVEPEREVAQLLPFADDPQGKFLLPAWSGDPYALMAALNAYDRSDSSSSAETTLLAAAKALGERSGTRAVLLMTDAESSSYQDTATLWAALAAVRPRVFTLETSSAGSAASQDLMQSWADAAGGYYDYARTVGDFEIGFARATCQLRRPAAYRLRVETRDQAPPGPGSISVVRAGGAKAGAPVEIILDASGSMNKKLGGEPRIEMAKRVLLGLTGDALPAGTPFALRVFGHRQPNACRTDLELPLAPLEPEAVAALVPTISPKLLSGTPIAESLRAAAADLQGAPSPQTIVLLTDGEESCGGDVPAAIAALAAQGGTVQLNVIGFSDAEAPAKAQFQRWAELGGGQFLEAGSHDELAAALEAVLTPPFEVFDATGQLVARGRVGGEPVSVPAGIYTVEVAGEVFEAVRVPGEQAVVLSVAAPRP